jgi:hypothetical protein
VERGEGGGGRGEGRRGSGEGRAGKGRVGKGRAGKGRGGRCVRADTHVRADAGRLGCVCADLPCFTSDNFKKDATVRPSHGRPRVHRLIVRPSVRPKTFV